MITPNGRASQLNGRYLVRNPALNAFLRLSDAVLARLVAKEPSASPSPSPSPSPARGRPRRLLIAIGGHLGDAVIATSVLPLLARWSPETELGMLVPSAAATIVDGHPRLRWIHVVDHWKTNRAAQHPIEKWKRYGATRRRTLREMSAVGYDAAVDLYAFYPNMAGLLWRAGIPTRIGYRSGGYGPLYTRAIEWRFTHEHTAVQHLTLLAELDRAILHEAAPAELRYDLPPLGAAAIVDADAILDSAGLTRGSFVVLHPGAGARHKAWPVAHWRALAARLQAGGDRVVVTGAGVAEARAAKLILERASSGVNLCGLLSWPDFRGVMAAARAVVGVDSVAVHVASGDGTPCVAIVSGVNDVEQWRPLGDRCGVVTVHTPCAPCFRKTGCGAMECIREVTVDAVLRAIEAVADPRDSRRGVPLSRQSFV